MPRRSRLLPEPLDLGGESFGQRLARFRKQKGLTQVELAEKMGLVQALISRYEHGRLRPHADLVARFALALGVSSDELLGLTAPKRAARGHQSAPAAQLDRRFLRRLQQIERLPKRDQDALLRTMDAFLKSRAA